jgi:hypothetical protein
MTRKSDGTPRRARRRVAVLALLAAAAVGACSPTGGGKANQTDTGQGASPSGQGHPDLSATPNVPDSGSGVAGRTGRPGISGDSLGRGHDTGSAAETPALPRDTSARSRRHPRP